MTKFLVLATIIDDTCDRYASFSEIKSLAECVERCYYKCFCIHLFAKEKLMLKSCYVLADGFQIPQTAYQTILKSSTGVFGRPFKILKEKAIPTTKVS